MKPHEAVATAKGILARPDAASINPMVSHGRCDQSATCAEVLSRCRAGVSLSGVQERGKMQTYALVMCWFLLTDLCVCVFVSVCVYLCVCL